MVNKRLYCIVSIFFIHWRSQDLFFNAFFARIPVHYKQTAAWLAQLGERRSAEGEVTGSNAGWTNTQGL